MNKITFFLDMDGVFNICAGPKPTFWVTGLHFEKHLVERLNIFLDTIKNPEFQIVISSTWRDDMEDLQKQLEKVGFRHWNKVIGKTSYNFEMKPNNRGLQILEYINDNNIEKYIIIDDYIDNITNAVELDKDRIIETSSYYGISVEDIEKIKRVI